ncbi:hypothetical protein BVK87_30495 [Achromobacter denitrificans]|nr:hypothetical protein BVK87_30495 [Achromobacter denitrificans]
MGCARWAHAFLRRRSRALPILQNSPPNRASKKKPAARKTAGFSSRRCRSRDGGEVLLMFLLCGASGMAAIGAAYGAMRERGRLRLDKLMP